MLPEDKEWEESSTEASAPESLSMNHLKSFLAPSLFAAMPDPGSAKLYAWGFKSIKTGKTQHLLPELMWNGEAEDKGTTNTELLKNVC